MKSYIITTGVLFVLLVVAHIARIVGEGWYLARDPFFVTATVVAGGLAGWAWRLARQPSSAP